MGKQNADTLQKGKYIKSKYGKKQEKAEIIDSHKVDQIVAEHEMKKGPKGLPSHWGPKIRHNRAMSQPAGKKKKRGQGQHAKLGQNQEQLAVKHKTEDAEKVG